MLEGLGQGLQVEERELEAKCVQGRVDESFIWHAFRGGAPMVLVSGCHFTDCHYINAVIWTQKRVDKVWNRMEKLGLRPERLQLEWISAAEGQKFARVMRELDEMRKQVTPEEVVASHPDLAGPLRKRFEMLGVIESLFDEPK